MRRSIPVVMATILLVPMAACAGTSEEETSSYHVDQSVTALDVGAVTVEPAGA